MAAAIAAAALKRISFSRFPVRIVTVAPGMLWGTRSVVGKPNPLRIRGSTTIGVKFLWNGHLPPPLAPPVVPPIVPQEQPVDMEIGDAQEEAEPVEMEIDGGGGAVQEEPEEKPEVINPGEENPPEELEPMDIWEEDTTPEVFDPDTPLAVFDPDDCL